MNPADKAKIEQHQQQVNKALERLMENPSDRNIRQVQAEIKATEEALKEAQS